VFSPASSKRFHRDSGKELMQDDLSNVNVKASRTKVAADSETMTAMRPRRDLQAVAACGGIASLAVAVLGAGILFRPPAASAVPSFARQTGQPCATCHTAFPELTPFGRRFKLNGYTMGGGLTIEEAPPVAVMLQPSFTHTARNQDSPPVPGTSTNNNTVLEDSSLFYGGQIYGNLGALIQATHDRATEHTFLDNSDVRYADTASILGLDFIYGVDVNNNPSVQDVWNTTPAWSFPYIASSLAPAFAPPGTLIEGSLGQKVVGTGAYTFWNDMLYLEVSAYQNLSTQALRALGEAGINDISIGGAAPYWRAAFEYNLGEQSFEIGTFGMYANVLPSRIQGFGYDQYLDIGFDAQYQYIGDPHSVTLKLTHIAENQQLNSTFVQGGTTNLYNTLETFKVSADYVYDHTYSLTAAYFSVVGTADAGLYAANSVANSPDGKGLIFDLAYLPFSKGGPSVWPWLNARIGVSYTHYLQLYGGFNNFDGAFHNASQNNTLFAYVWIAF
jgi:hypothetical protein